MGHVFSFPERKFLVFGMNSSFARDYLMRNRRSNIHLYPEDWKTLPIPDVDTKTQSQITTLVDRLLAAKQSGDHPTAAALDREVDEHVARLYCPSNDNAGTLKLVGAGDERCA